MNMKQHWWHLQSVLEAREEGAAASQEDVHVAVGLHF